jgi:AP endonuclease-1
MVTFLLLQTWQHLSENVAGTAILCKVEPISVKLDFPTHKNAEEAANGRILVLEFANTFVIGTYVPNAGQGLKVISLRAPKVYSSFIEYSL